MDHELAIARPLAPEDMRPDTHVAVLSVMTEHLTFAELCGLDEPYRRRGIVRTSWLPCRDVGVPLRIAEVCLPFLLVERPDGAFAALDTRRVRLGLLSASYAKKAGKRLRAGRAAKPASGA